jgi:hypothetical protein
MIGPRSLADALTSGGRYALDVPVAALAGLSVAFLVYAMPGDTLAGLVGATGLASVVPAAEPPLGMTARIGIGAAGAVAVFAAAFLMLRWLDRLGSRHVERDDPAEMEAPRLRRRDFHPDAPPRPPIMATHELGEPAPPSWPEESRDTPVPPEPLAEIPDMTLPPAAEEEWLLDAPMAAEAPAPEPPPFPMARPEPESEPESAPVPEIVPVAEARAPVQAAAPSGSLDDLMARLEQGLARRRQGPAEAVIPDPATQPAAPTDDRLQSAIDSLQRLAARGD